MPYRARASTAASAPHRSPAPARPSSVPAGPLRLLQNHARALYVTLARLGQHAVGTALTLCVVAVVLSLPATLVTLFRDMAPATLQLGERSAQATLYLRDSVTPAAGEALTERIAHQPGIAAARYISRDAALAEFRQQAGAAAAVALLDTNPLPASIVVTPDIHRGQAATRTILNALAAMPEVEQAQRDPAWTDQLYAGFSLLKNLLWLALAALALTILIVVGNTIRLEIEDRRHEIAIMKLIGASNAYVRRPFLYMGACYGVGGAVFALLLVALVMQLLEYAVRESAVLGNTGMVLAAPGFDTSVALLVTGLVLGWIAAVWTVARHLHRIEPR